MTLLRYKIVEGEQAAGHLIVLPAVFDLPIDSLISVFEKEREFGERY